MRLYSTSETELSEFGVGEELLLSYKRVRDALTKADRPPSDRTVVDGGAQLPACSFDPIIQEAINTLNKHLTWMFFVAGTSWADLDDDKIPNCSPLWKQYGMKMTPTKDKKLKPVFHVMALIGAGYISYVTPDLLHLKLRDMMKKAIKHVTPAGQASLRASLAFFINRGYLELFQAQGVKITNLIQLMEALGVKFLGTIKDSKSFPFQIVDLNDSPNTVSNGRPVVQGYGTRTSFTARSGDKVASVMRHGAGKVQLEQPQTWLSVNKTPGHTRQKAS